MYIQYNVDKKFYVCFIGISISITPVRQGLASFLRTHQAHQTSAQMEGLALQLPTGGGGGRQRSHVLSLSQCFVVG